MWFRGALSFSPLCLSHAWFSVICGLGHSVYLPSNYGTVTYPSIIEKKNYCCFTRLLKTIIFSFERCLAIFKNKVCKEIGINCKFKEFLVSFPDCYSYDLHLLFGGHYALSNCISWFALIKTSWNSSSNLQMLDRNILLLIIK